MGYFAGTYFDRCVEQLRTLAESLDLNEATIRQALNLTVEPWFNRPIPERPAYLSDVGDDHTPFEYSAAFDERDTELRLLTEVHGAPPTLLSNQRSALALNDSIQREFGTPFDRFNAIRDLFVSDRPGGLFTLWHSIGFRSNRKPSFKLYLNPQLHGVSEASGVTEEAMQRLGFTPETIALLNQIAFRGAALDETKYFALDLSDDSKARVKIYYRHHDVSVSELEHICEFAPSHIQGDAERFVRGMMEYRDRYRKRPISTCFSFVAGQSEPSAVTMYAPVADYCPDDRYILEHTATFMDRHSLPGNRYRRMVDKFAQRDLSLGTGLHSYVAYRRTEHSHHVTAYLSAEVFTSPLSTFAPANDVAVQTTSQT